MLCYVVKYWTLGTILVGFSIPGGIGQADDSVQSRGLNVPSASVPAPIQLPSSSSIASPRPVPMTTPAAPAPVPLPYPVVPSKLNRELTAMSTMIADGTSTDLVMDAWKNYVTKRVQGKQPIDVPGTIRQLGQQAEVQIRSREAQIKARIDAQKMKAANTVNAMGDDAQLANVDLQNQLQKQQQVMQMLSNILKMMHDTAMAIIRNLKG
jgi:hypothetical protein